VHVYWNRAWKPSGALAGLLIYKNSSFENHGEEGVGVKSSAFLDGRRVVSPGSALIRLAVAQSRAKYFVFIERVRGMRNTSSMGTTKKSLAQTHPALAKEANGWDPNEAFSSDKRNYEWICSLGHVWIATINNRAGGSGCHYCGNKKVLVGFNDLATTHPELAMQAFEWDPTTVVAGMKAGRAWRCEKGHTWAASVYNRARVGAGCPYCAGTKVWPGFNDLLTKFPSIAAQAQGWDPSLVHSGEHKKRNWICSKSHIWQAVVGTRTLQSSGCPVCSNKLLQSGANDLATLNKELAAQADGWDPTTVLIGSGLKLAWKCPLGHKFTASVYSRTSNSNRGCPTCAGKQILIGFNDLQTTHPEVAAEADGWDPTTVSKGSAVRRAWKCAYGHRWQSNVATRASRKRGCPICAGQQVQTGFNDLATTHPELSKQALGWDPTTKSKGSTERVEWRCESGHQWIAVIGSRTVSHAGCPYCSGLYPIVGENDLATTHPNIAAQAHGWDPTTISRGSAKTLQWKCPIGHIYKSSPASRALNGDGCSYCSGHQFLQGFNDIATTHPELADEADGWDPSQFGRGGKTKMKWICPKKHSYVSTISQRAFNQTGCPICAGRSVLAGYNDIATLFPDIARQADGWDPTSFVAGSNKKLRWICDEGHYWIAVVNDRTYSSRGCPTCAKAGFDPNKDGWLYFLTHPEWDLFQIGITNNPSKRVGTHMKSGWEVLEIRGPMDGHLTQEWETAILRMLRSKGADLSNSQIAGKFDGYSEAWSQVKFQVDSIKELMRLTEEFEVS